MGSIKKSIALQQKNWMIRLDGYRHPELECQFCDYVEHEKFASCADCPITIALEMYCTSLISWKAWQEASSVPYRKASALAVLKDINDIARYYHYKTVKI